MKRKFMSVVLVLAMLFTFVPTAFADSTPLQVVTVTKIIGDHTNITSLAKGNKINLKVTMPSDTKANDVGSFDVRLWFDKTKLKVISAKIPKGIPVKDTSGNNAGDVSVTTNLVKEDNSSETTKLVVDVNAANTDGVLTANAISPDKKGGENTVGVSNGLQLLGAVVIDVTLEVTAEDGLSSKDTGLFTFTTFEIAKHKDGNKSGSASDTKEIVYSLSDIASAVDIWSNMETVAYSSTPPNTPTAATNANGTVKLTAQPISGETVEYAVTKGSETTAPTDSSCWNTTGEFAGLEVGKEYTFWARVKASEKHKAGEAVSATITVKKPALGGTVSISNSNTTHGTESPKIGDELTVNTASLTYIDTGILSYQWYRSNNSDSFDLIANETGASYTLTTTDLGKTIKVEVSNSKNEGTVSAVTTGAVSKKDGPEAPSTTPSLVSKTTSSIEVSYTKSNVEFACVKAIESVTDSTTWEPGEVKTVGSVSTYNATFDGLEANTAYNIYVRFKATDDTNPSAKSTALSVTTKANATITINDPGTITYDGSAVVAAKSEESGADADLTYIYNGNGNPQVKWYADNSGSKGDELSDGAPKNAGTYWIGVSASGSETYAAAEEVTKKFVISPKSLSGAATVTLSSNGAAYANLVYSGSAQSVDVDSVILDGVILAAGDYEIVTADSTTSATNAGTYTLKIKGKGNYTGEAPKTWEITKALTTADCFNVADTTKTYDGQKQEIDKASITVKDNITGMGTVEKVYYEGIASTVYAKSETAPTDAGTYKILFNVKEISDGSESNYSSASGLEYGKLTIEKATMDESKTKGNMTVRDTDMKEYTYTLPALPEGARYGSATITHTTTNTLIEENTPSVTKDASGKYILTYSAHYCGSGNGSADIRVAVTGAKNYNDYDFVLTVTGQEKSSIHLSFKDVPSSKTYGDADFEVEASKNYEGEGTWTWTSSDSTVLEIVGAGDSNKLETEEGKVTVKVKNASSTGAYLTVSYEDDNYKGDTTTSAIIVHPKTVTISGITAADKRYDGTKTATVSTESAQFAGKIEGDTLGISATGEFADKTAGESKIVNLTLGELTGTDKDNYVLAATGNQTTATAKIERKAVTISGITAENRAYNGTTSVTLDGTSASISGKVSTDNVSVDMTNAHGAITDANASDTAKNVEVTGVALTGTDAANYILTSQPSGITVNIIKANPTVTAPTAKTLIYNGSEQELINAGTTSGGTMKYRLGDTVEYSTAIPTAKDATTYSVSWIVEGGSNYNGNDGGTITANISPKELTIYPALVSVTKGTEPVLELTYVGLVEGDTAGLSVTPEFELRDKDNKVVSLDEAKNTVGIYTITWSNKNRCSLTNPNYTIATSSQTGTLTVTANSSGGSGGGSYAKTHAVSASKVGNGSVSVDKESAKAGTTVTVIAKADAGYVLEKIEVKDAGGAAVTLTKTGDDTYTFIMPASDATLNAVFAVGSATFVDVPVGTLYYDPVEWAVARGITTGTDKTHFSPDRSCTRAEIVTFLWRAAGSPAVTATSAFTDVSANAYYAKAVAWATENGITNGTSATTFSPNATCTRAQGVAFLYRAQKSPAVSGSPVFTDVAANAYYANAVVWAVDSGVTNGIGDGLFGSDNDCTRAHIVAFLYRMMK